MPWSAEDVDKMLKDDKAGGDDSGARPPGEVDLGGTIDTDDPDEMLKQLGLSDPGDPGDPDEAGKEGGETTDDWQEKAFGDVELPKELKGKKPEEVLRLYNTMRGMTETLLQNAKAAGAAPAAPAAPPEPEKPIFTEEDDLSNLDPKTFEQKVAALFERKATPLVTEMRRSAVITAMNTARDTLPYFKKYNDEITAAARQATPEQLSDPRSWKLLHDSVVMNHLDEIVDERAQDKSGNRPVVEFTETGGAPARGGGGSVTLNAEERTIAEGLGVHPKVYLAMKKARMGG